MRFCGYIANQGLPDALRLSGLIWIDLSSICRLSLLHIFSNSGLRSGPGRRFATVDHSDIRGLVTDITSLRHGTVQVY